MSDPDRLLWNRDEDYRKGIQNNGLRLSKDSGSATQSRGKFMTSGFHHLVIVCRDMNTTARFYEEALGLKLRAIFPMHGVKGTKHAFLEVGNGCELSFVQFPKHVEPVIGVSSPATPGSYSAIGSLHHLSFKADSIEQLYNLRKQVKATGIVVSPVLSHSFCHSFYFCDPNGVQLEVTYTIRPYKAEEYDLNLLEAPVTSSLSVDIAGIVKEAAAYRKATLSKAKL